MFEFTESYDAIDALLNAEAPLIRFVLWKNRYNGLTIIRVSTRRCCSGTSDYCAKHILMI